MLYVAIEGMGRVEVSGGRLVGGRWELVVRGKKDAMVG